MRNDETEVEQFAPTENDDSSLLSVK